MTDGSPPGRGRVLVTGSTGFVGRRLMARLGERMAPTDLLGLRGPDGSGHPDAIDLSDADAARRVIAAFGPTTIVHLAAQSSVGAGGADPAGVWTANFDATRAVAQAASDLNHPARMIFASSGEVYGGRFNHGPCSEDGPIEPMSSYSRSKAACEYLLRDMAGPDLEVVVLRLFNHTGPGQDERFVVPSFAAQIARLAGQGAGAIHVGNLDARRDFTDVDDVIDAYLAVIESARGPAYSLYNVGSGVQLEIRTILDMMIRAHGAEVQTILDPARQRPSEIALAAGVFQKFQDTFGWTPKRPFETTVRAVLAHEKSRLAKPA